MTIKEYFEYQSQSLVHEPQNIRDDDGMIKFGVNIDIETWKNTMEELQTKLPEDVLWNTEYDVMKYLKQQIKGVNLPQLYMKVINTTNSKI